MKRDVGDPADQDRNELLVKVARLYHQDELNQDKIAELTGCSRSTVSRLLSEAKSRRIVRVVIEQPLGRAFGLERQLGRKFGLKEALVATQEHDAASAASVVGALGARAVVDIGTNHARVALSNGSSLAAVVNAMAAQQWPRSCVIQMVGSLGNTKTVLLDGPDLCRRLADRLGGSYQPLAAPLIMGSVTAARAVRREQAVVTALELAARSDIALVGVGSVGPRGQSGALLEPYLTPQLHAEIDRAGGVAHICGHHFDGQGRRITTSLSGRTISMDPEQLAEIPMSIAVAWGQQKVPAIYSILRSGFINCLATDEQTARLVLSYSG